MWISVELRVLPATNCSFYLLHILLSLFSWTAGTSAVIFSVIPQTLGIHGRVANTENTEVPLSTPLPEALRSLSGTPIRSQLTNGDGCFEIHSPRSLLSFFFALFWLRPQEQYWLGVGTAHLLLALITFSPDSPGNYGVSD